MCDCYTAKCEECGCDIEIHIADFCTDRANVHPYCPKCTKEISIETILKFEQIFLDTTGRFEKGVDGEKVIILCNDSEAYGIHLN